MAVNEVVLERVARAMAALDEDGRGVVPDWTTYKASARAAILSMQAFMQKQIRPEAQPTPSPSTHLVGWMYEDELPKSYPYDAMFPHSKVDGVRMFPVYAPVSPDDTGPLTVPYPVHMIAHNLLVAHTGSEGGNPTVDWYKLRDEISDAIAVALDNQRKLDTPPQTRAAGEYKCPKCGAGTDERYDCCEVHEMTNPKELK